MKNCKMLLFSLLKRNRKTYKKRFPFLKRLWFLIIFFVRTIFEEFPRGFWCGRCLPYWKIRITYLIRHDGISTPSLCVGRDGRLSGKEMQEAFIKAHVLQGQMWQILEKVRLPCSFSICHGKFDGGVNITASHNPREYNGFKLQRHDAHAICGDEILAIRDLCHTNDLKEGEEHDKKNLSFRNISKTHVSLSQSQETQNCHWCRKQNSREVCSRTFSQLGVNVIPLYCEVDGNFPTSRCRSWSGGKSQWFEKLFYKSKPI